MRWSGARWALQARARRYRHGWRVCGKYRSNFPHCRATVSQRPSGTCPSNSLQACLAIVETDSIWLIFIVFLMKIAQDYEGVEAEGPFLDRGAAGTPLPSLQGCIHGVSMKGPSACTPRMAPDYLRSIQGAKTQQSPPRLHVPVTSTPSTLKYPAS